MNGFPEKKTSEDAPDVNPFIGIGKNEQSNIPYGYCHCGCGQKTPIAKRTRKELGHKKGHPIRFIKGHNIKGSLSPWWKGGAYIDKAGYKSILKRSHLRAYSNGYVYEHIFIAENVLGKSLPPKAEIHHVDENPENNKNFNLVVCEDRAYHFLLHKRKKAYDACGDASWLKCWVCQQYDNPNNLYVSPDQTNSYHKECINRYNKERLQHVKILRQRRKEISQCHNYY